MKKSVMFKRVIFVFAFLCICIACFELSIDYKTSKKATPVNATPITNKIVVLDARTWNS